MKTNDVNLSLDLQAYADGQLDQLALGRREELERLVSTDASAKALVENLRAFSRGIRRGEPIHIVPASREFYWSQIQRRLDIAESGKEVEGRPKAASTTHWLRWLLPVFGTAAIAISLTLGRGGISPSSGVTLADGGLSESGSGESEAMVFRSESDGVTIHWLN